MPMQLSKYVELSKFDGNVLAFDSLNGKFYRSSDLDSLQGKTIYTEDLEKLAFFKLQDEIHSSELDLTIILTRQCNFRCLYCYEDFSDDIFSEQDEKSLLSFLRKNLSKYSSLHISWFGGEPLLNVDTIRSLSFKMMQLCSKCCIPYRAGITTNGFLLTPRLCQELISYGISSFQITLDGTREIHDKYRVLVDTGAGTFDKILTNLADIKNYIVSRNVSFRIRCNVTQSTLAILDEYLTVMDKYFGDDLRFEFVFNAVGDWGGDSVYGIKDSLLNRDSILWEFLLSNPIVLNYSPYCHTLRNMKCYAARKNQYVLLPGGSIGKCTVRFNSPYNLVGKLSEKGNMSLSKSKISDFIYPAPLDCKNCSLFPVCGGNSCPSAKIEGSVCCNLIKPVVGKIMGLLYRADQRYNLGIYSEIGG